jgi:hypothetical protein
MERKFQLGDRIFAEHRGEKVTGTVVMIREHLRVGDDSFYAIEFDNDKSGLKTEFFMDFNYDNFEYLPGRHRSEWKWEEQLEHARIANTEIARKLYPHYEENGEWLMLKEQK